MTRRWWTGWAVAAVALALVTPSESRAQSGTDAGPGAASGAPAPGGVPSGAAAGGDAGSPSIVTSGAAPADDAGVMPSTSGISGVLDEPPAAAIAPRPPPTSEQVEALRLLEAEVGGFIERGEGFRGSINGLLRREHERQLDRLRSGFSRQIAAERDAEGQARRHAIQVFERFLELYPDDPDHTPDVMFRLAELYYDEAQIAKLESDEQVDRLRAEREAAGQSTEDLHAPPVDYRCSILLYRHVIDRFQSFRLRDASHYLLGWVLKEMGREEESITAYRGLVCPAHFHYQPEIDLAAPLVPDQSTPVVCGHLFDVLRPYGAQMETPPGSGPTTASTQSINQTLVAPGTPSAGDPMPIPQDYAECTPLNGSNGRPSRYAGEVWYFIGDYHFANPPPTNSDLGNAYAIAAYRASMRASETRNPLAAVSGRTSGATLPPPALDPGSGGAGGVTPANSPGRSQFDADTIYGPFWSKALYQVGWSYFRMINGYPRALENFALLLDYYDWAGSEATTGSNRSDTIKWIGVIFSESTWGAGGSADAQECQALVESVARPPAEATRPFDCAGIMRITSPLPPAAIMGARDAASAARVMPIPGRPRYIPQDRPWTPEAYLELANDYFQQTKYYEAITLYRIFLQLYPLHFQAPHVAESIAVSYERQRQFDMAISARGRLAQYTEGTAWHQANMSHPDAQRYAELVARNSLHDNAIQYHQRASQERNDSSRLRQCSAGTTIRSASPEMPPFCTGARNATERQELENRAYEMLQRSQRDYALAIEAYNLFIENYHTDEAAYEFRYNRADAMFWAGRYADAARAYGEVRESNENDQFLPPAAYMAVKALEAQVRTDAQNGRLDPCLAVRAGIAASELRNPQSGQALLDETRARQCTDIPTAGNAPAAAHPPITQLNIPDVVRSLMEARIAYTNRVPRTLDTCTALHDVYTCDGHAESDPPFRAKFAYLNARTLMRYGHASDAEARYRQVLATYCNDPTVAGATFADLYNLLLTQGRDDDREALAAAQHNTTCAGVNQDIVSGALTDREFRLALDLFNQAQQAQTRGATAESLQLYERSANAMRGAVNGNRNHPQAPLALYYTALAYERTNRFDTATQTYMRVTHEYNNLNVIGANPPRELEGEPRQQRINILEVSNFRAAVNMDRTFDYDHSIEYFNTVVSDARFATAEAHAAHVHDSLASIALTQTNLGRWQQARDAWRAFLPRAEGDRERSTVQYRIAEMPFRAQDWPGAVRAFQEYRRTIPMNANTAEFHVQAQYNIATALRNQNDQAGYRRELRNVARVFRESGQRPGTPAARYAGEALFADLDRQITEFTQRTLTQGTDAHLAAEVSSMMNALTEIDAAATEIFNLSAGEYSIGALVRRGEAHEHLATQEVRIGQLVQFSPAQTHEFERLERQATTFEHQADQFEAANPNAATRLRNAAQMIRDRVQQARDNATTGVQQRFDREAEAQRTLAIQSYALAIHLARRDNVPTIFAARALEHIRLEENRPLMEPAIRSITPAVAAAARFTYTPGMFDAEAPGATVTQQQPVATPGLAGE